MFWSGQNVKRAPSEQTVEHACTGLCRFLCPGQEKKGEGVRGAACTCGYNRVQAVRPGSVAGGGCFEVLWNLECPVGLSQREIYTHFNEGNLSYLPKTKLWSYVVFLNLVGRK